MARALGMRPRPKIPVPLITPWLSALWLGLVTPVDTNVARPLVEGLRTATVVSDPSGAEPFGIEPMPFDETLRRALEEERGGRRVEEGRWPAPASMLFTCDLRVRDNAALAAAAQRMRAGGGAVRARRGAARRHLRQRQPHGVPARLRSATSTGRCVHAAAGCWCEAATCVEQALRVAEALRGRLDRPERRRHAIRGEAARAPRARPARGSASSCASIPGPRSWPRASWRRPAAGTTACSPPTGGRGARAASPPRSPAPRRLPAPAGPAALRLPVPRVAVAAARPRRGSQRAARRPARERLRRWLADGLGEYGSAERRPGARARPRG